MNYPNQCSGLDGGECACLVEVQGLSGRECSSCGDVEFDPESAKRYAEAGDELVLLARQRERNQSGAFDGS